MQAARTVSALALVVVGAWVSLAATSQNPPPPPPTPPTVEVYRGTGNRSSQILRPGQQLPPLVATGLIVGRVVDAASGRGVPGAVVTLNGGPTRTVAPQPPGALSRPAPPPPPPPPQVLTDGEGRFAFRNLTRGNYSLGATRPGYAPGSYGRLQPGGPGRSFQLDDGEKIADATIRLLKYGSLTGTIVDEAGEPVVLTPVRAYRRVLMSGRRVLSPTGGLVQTDDRGVYRLGALLPGEYVVVAPFVAVTAPGAVASTPASRQNLQASAQTLTSGGSPSPGTGGQAATPDGRFILQRATGAGDVSALPDETGRLTSFATLYYPAAPTASAAQPIAIESGEDRSGIDLMLRRVPTASISGQVIAPDGPGAEYVLRLVAADGNDLSVEPEVAVAMSDATGAFTFLAVPAGDYLIRVVRIPRPGPPMSGGGIIQTMPTTSEPLLWASAPVSVGGDDVRGITLALREGLTISGRLEFAGSLPRPEGPRLSQIPIVLEPAEGRQQTSVGPPSRVQPDAQFMTTGQLPGKYFLRIGGAPAGWMLHSVVVNGVDGLETPIELSSGNVTNAVVTFTDLITDVRGTVRGVPATDEPPAVIVFPADSLAWRSFGVNPVRLRMLRTGPTGGFVFGALPAGDYFAAAIPFEYATEYQDPAYLDVLSRTALRFTLGPGERRVIDVSLQHVSPPAIRRAPAPAAAPQPPPVAATTAGPAGDFERGPFVAETAPQQVRDTRAVPPAGSGSISGIVLTSDAPGRPARFARVTARGAGAQGERVAFTDDEGRFTIASLPAGSYQVFVTKPAYLPMYYGARRPVIGPGTSVVVAAGQAVTGLDITLTRGGVISGTVVGPDGEPAPGARIQLLQFTWVDGERVLGNASSSGASTADDRGAFRLFGLRPGSYVVSAIPPALPSGSEIRQLSDEEMRAALAEAAGATRPSYAADRRILPAPPGPLPAPTPPGRPVALSPVFYPGTTIDQEAGVISIGSGQPDAHVTIALQLVPTIRLDGTVQLPDGQPAPQAGTQISLHRVSNYSAATISVRMVEDGRFQAFGVPPGRYTLVARLSQAATRTPASAGAPPQSVAASTTLWAQQEIDVVGIDQSNIALTFSAPLTLSGRLTFEGGPPPDSEVQVRLDQAGRTVTGSSYARILRTNEDGAFTITGITPGRYRLSASMPGSSASLSQGSAPVWGVKSAVIGGRDAYEMPFEVEAGRPLQDALITMTNRLPQLSGTIQDRSGQPVTNMIVVLFPADRRYWTGSSARRVRTNAASPSAGMLDGSYRFFSLLPGEYYLAVVTELEPNALGDPAFLEQLIPGGVRLTLAEGDKKVQDLRIAG